MVHSAACFYAAFAYTLQKYENVFVKQYDFVYLCTFLDEKPLSMDYKKQYTAAELAELKAWFAAHKDQLPATLQLDQATFVPDVARAVAQLEEIADLHYANPTFSGQIYLLFKIRQKIEG